jgi:formylglycine-generating enzyme required for sulfatase activity
VCGDGVQNALAGELCDDGGESAGCDVDCTPSACGDGVANAAAGEQCDDAGDSARCDGDCTLPVCGDGYRNLLADPLCAPCAQSPGGCPALDWVMIDGGSFMMGSITTSAEQPVHQVSVPSFELLREEVTVGAYRACVTAGACSAPVSTAAGCLWTAAAGASEGRPINCVSWVQANQVATWLGARLPSEAEWEFAARSRGARDYPWGDAPPTCALARKTACGFSGAGAPCGHPTGSSAQGVCDLSGNLWEWVQDERHTSYSGAPVDGSGWCTGPCPVNSGDPAFSGYSLTIQHMVRGGSYNSTVTQLRAAARFYFSPTAGNAAVGVRLVRLGL